MLLIHEHRVRLEAKNRIDRDRQMDKNATYLMRAKFVYSAANLVCAFLHDSAEHHAPADFFNTLFEIYHDLGGAIEAGTERDDPDHRRTLADQLASRYIGAVAHFAHNFQHAFPGGICDVGHSIDHAGNRLV